MILAITGHRPHKLGGYNLPNPVANAVMLKLSESLKILKPEVVLTGMALGVDQWTAQICDEMQIPFDAIVAFKGYETKWPWHAQKWYRHLLGKARKVVTLSEGEYDPSLLHQRNYWMVDNSDALLAVWDGLPGSGTAGCVRYAQLKNPPKPAYRLDLTNDVWAMARVEEDLLKTRKAERNERLAFMGAAPAPPPPVAAKLPRPPPPPPTDAIVFRRFVDVGDDEP